MFKNFYPFILLGLLENIIRMYLSSDQSQNQKIIVLELIASILYDSGLFKNLYEAELWVRLMDINNLKFFMKILLNAYIQNIGDSKELTGIF